MNINEFGQLTEYLWEIPQSYREDMARAVDRLEPVALIKG